MCDVCGCGELVHDHAHESASPQGKRLVLEPHTSLLSRNDAGAAHLRAHFEAGGVTVLNVMGSPGSGKTALLEATAKALGGRARLAAVSGDLATTHDAERLSRAGIVSASITTGTACHLDAAMVHDALHDDALAAAVRACDFFFIENVGNLVCPALFDLGQRASVVALSVTEGVDKPLKYPVMFRNADLVVLTKVDLLPHLPDVSVAVIEENLARVMSRPRLIAVSATSGAGLGAWCEWLTGMRAGAASAADAAR